MNVRKAVPWLVAGLVFVLDRWSKSLVVEHIRPGSTWALCPGLSLSHVHNRGIAFSLFASGGMLSRILLHMVIFTAVVMIAWMLVRHGHHRLWAGLSFGLILGGALGNLYDRIAYGWVIDFIRIWVHHGGRLYSWPDFNIADSAITTGAILLLLSEFFRKPEVPEHASDTD